MPVSVEPGTTAEQRVAMATVRCVARWGLAKTTLDDIAREAGCSRATVYRLFPGGKAELIRAAGAHEAARLLLELTESAAGAPDLETLLVDAIGHAARFVADHEAIGMLLRHEPEVLLPVLAFDRLDPLIAMASTFLAPHLARFTDSRTAAEVVEWATRLIVSYSFMPSRSIDLTKPEDVRALVRGHLLPGIRFAQQDPTTSQGATHV